MPLIDRLESRLGRFAIPGLIQAIASLQLLTLLMFMILQPDARKPFEEYLLLNPEGIMRGEVWRLFTYVVIPSGNVFFAVVGAMFMMWLGRGLDEAWGAFRVNLYVIGGMVCLAAGAVIFGYEAGPAWFHLTTLFAFACIYPNEEILIFFILPVKIKWIAWLAAAGLFLTVLSSPAAVIPVFFALLNFLVAFGPGFIKGSVHVAQVAQRRRRFDEAQPAAGAFFHQCTVCGKTEVDDPALDFRVNDNGDEICTACRKPGSV